MRFLRGPQGASDARQRVRLDEREYVLRWRWLTRSSRWALDVLGADGTLLAGGISVVPMFPLLDAFRGARPEMPPGELMILDLRRSPQMPTLEGLGRAPSQIVYFDAADLSAIDAEAA